MHHHLPLLALLLLTATSGARADGPLEALLAGVEGDLGRFVGVGGLPGLGGVGPGVIAALSPVAGQAADAALRTSQNLSSAIAGHGQRVAGLDGRDALLVGSGDARQAASMCSGAPLAGHFTLDGMDPALVLAFGGPPGSACPPRAAQWRLNQLSGDWQQGWRGTAASGALVERAWLGPHGNGAAISVVYEAWQGATLAYRFVGTAADFA